MERKKYYCLTISNRLWKNKLDEIKQYIYDNKLDKQINEFASKKYWQISNNENIKFNKDLLNWNTYIEDLKRLSLCYEDEIFTLSTQGEYLDDNHRYYFYNGKVQYAHITIKFDQFNKNKLED